jgi:hypothetical protein
MLSMRRFVVTILALLSAVTLSAQTTARGWIDALNASLGERYAYGLWVEVGDSLLYGAMQVEDDSYHMILADMEVYSDGRLRYEINNARKEVTEDRVNLESRDLLTNPTRAFDFVDDEFDIVLQFSQNDEIAVVKLVPRDSSLGITSIKLALMRSGDKVRPLQILYDYDGDKVKIMMSPSEEQWQMPRWDKEAYKAYDMVSFL